jgi:hypothetical protein
MNKEDPVAVEDTRIYKAPRLRIYGDVLQLTAAGTGTTKEASGGKEATDPTRQRP